jgi:hypothetical protein
MKCKGRIKNKNSSGLKQGKLCNAVIDDHAIFCPVCGTPTDALKTALSARKVFREVWAEQRNEAMKFSVTGILLMVLTLALLYSVFFLTAELYYITNLILLLVVPFLIIPFVFRWEEGKVDLSLGSYLSALKYYPPSWLFMLLNIFYYFLLKVICTGYLLTIATDPILHLVRFILSLYWLAVIFPMPYLLLKKKLSLFKALKLSYAAGSETRWQHFYLILFVVFMNLLALIPLGLGLIFTLPLSYRMLQRYYSNMEEYELFEQGRV